MSTTHVPAYQLRSNRLRIGPSESGRKTPEPIDNEGDETSSSTVVVHNENDEGAKKTNDSAVMMNGGKDAAAPRGRPAVSRLNMNEITGRSGSGAARGGRSSSNNGVRGASAGPRGTTGSAHSSRTASPSAVAAPGEPHRFHHRRKASIFHQETSPRRLASLDNFEQVKHSKVLNSPRSLQACEVHGIATSELVPKTLTNFGGPGVPQHIAQLRWDHYDERRLQKVAMLAAYRDALIQQEAEDAAAAHTTPSRPTQIAPAVKSTAVVPAPDKARRTASPGTAGRGASPANTSSSSRRHGRVSSIVAPGPMPTAPRSESPRSLTPHAKVPGAQAVLGSATARKLPPKLQHAVMTPIAADHARAVLDKNARRAATAERARLIQEDRERDAVRRLAERAARQEHHMSVVVDEKMADREVRKLLQQDVMEQARQLKKIKAVEAERTKQVWELKVAERFRDPFQVTAAKLKYATPRSRSEQRPYSRTSSAASAGGQTPRGASPGGRVSAPPPPASAQKGRNSVIGQAHRPSFSGLVVADGERAASSTEHPLMLRRSSSHQPPSKRGSTVSIDKSANNTPRTTTGSRKSSSAARPSTGTGRRSTGGAVRSATPPAQDAQATRDESPGVRGFTPPPVGTPAAIADHVRRDSAFDADGAESASEIDGAGGSTAQHHDDTDAGDREEAEDHNQDQAVHEAAQEEEGEGEVPYRADDGQVETPETSPERFSRVEDDAPFAAQGPESPEHAPAQNVDEEIASVDVVPPPAAVREMTPRERAAHDYQEYLRAQAATAESSSEDGELEFTENVKEEERQPTPRGASATGRKASVVVLGEDPTPNGGASPTNRGPQSMDASGRSSPEGIVRKPSLRSPRVVSVMDDEVDMDDGRPLEEFEAFAEN